jgi:hypothetical protein
VLHHLPAAPPLAGTPEAVTPEAGTPLAGFEKPNQRYPDSRKSTSGHTEGPVPIRSTQRIHRKLLVKPEVMYTDIDAKYAGIFISRESRNVKFWVDVLPGVDDIHVHGRRKQRGGRRAVSITSRYSGGEADREKVLNMIEEFNSAMSTGGARCEWLEAAGATHLQTLRQNTGIGAGNDGHLNPANRRRPRGGRRERRRRGLRGTEVADVRS